MSRIPMKRRRSVVPIQRSRAGVWDDNGGVFTQENPRGSSQIVPKESKCKYCYKDYCKPSTNEEIVLGNCCIIMKSKVIVNIVRLFI